ncbi:MAG: hypothetical protein A2751_05695 [Candidatus Doudnabacteria bacterium RIFCSPHIGHO2_01_FULL_46_14]|uniref:Ribbon-helix-helix protein CopG domain-containing protein n=1 Tax=Candidatus Doudnabacteria bacterium RIFCSPHIGHO2_01_FULL_46_14 TaxID=1817824 RepID=A0A1F5NN37_9BACT|nr:MAG: hypothetical protein A2751_05695 [Candidatus Doudnabacteria bacterium RIFCSPHIGHO2_01_FULL_46_14]
MKTKTFNIALPDQLVRKIDQTAKREYQNRSEFIREAVRVYLAQKEKWADLFAYGQKIGRKMGIKSEEDVNRIVYEYRHGKRQSQGRS